MPDARSKPNGGDKRSVPSRKRKPAVQSGGGNSRPARNDAKTTRTARSQGLDPGEWRVNAKSAVSFTLYDCTGAPLRPELQKEIEEWAESVAKREHLLLNVAQG